MFCWLNTTFNIRNIKNFIFIYLDINYDIKYDINNYDQFYADKIVAIANNPKLGKQEDWSIVNENAEIAKCAAFVALLGIDTAGNQLSYEKREEYKNKAIDILEDCDPKNLWNAFYWENQQYRAKELIYCFIWIIYDKYI